MAEIKRKTNLVGMLIVIITCILLSYTIYDAAVVRPDLRHKIDTVNTQFQNLKVFLDAKLPEIDSVLIVHTNQINEQNVQLNRLNEITTLLKEKD